MDKSSTAVLIRTNHFGTEVASLAASIADELSPSVFILCDVTGGPVETGAFEMVPITTDLVASWQFASLPE